MQGNKFFSDDKRLKTIADFVANFGNKENENKLVLVRVKAVCKTLAFILDSPQLWSDRCSFNTAHIGNKFIDTLRKMIVSNEMIASNEMKEVLINELYVMCYRLLCEFDFFSRKEEKNTWDIRNIITSIRSDNEEMSDEIKSQIVFASYIMPAQITKEIITSKNIDVFFNFEDSMRNAAEFKEEWDKEISYREKSAKQLEEKISKYNAEFNFIGLNKGFYDLGKMKKKEARNIFLALLLMGLVILTPLAYQIAIIQYNNTPTNQQLLAFVPFISIEIILIYFFRILLSNHRSVKAQILQIELRQTLCQFIQSYIDYSSKMKKTESNALDKFENLIFSGILSNPEDLPSTFDGFNQIGNLIKSVKKT